MEFNEKLQTLRKQKGITQDELANALYVTRAAVAKWESGRGYPNIESLKNIAEFFSVTVDELLSGNEILTIAKEESRQKEKHFRDLLFGLLDIGALMFLFLPLFGQTTDGIIKSVGLLKLTEVPPYLKTAYFTVIIAIAALGILMLSLKNYHFTVLEKIKSKISLILNVSGVLLFIISSQPYAAALLFVFLIIKTAVLINKP